MKAAIERKETQKKQKDNGTTSDGLRKEQRDQYMAIFKMIDVSGDGTLSANELKRAMDKLGEKLTDADVEDIIDGIDEDGNRTIDFKEFLELVRERGKNPKLCPAAIQAFKLFTGRDDDVITWNEFQKILGYFVKGKEKYDVDSLMENQPWTPNKELDFTQFLGSFYDDL